MTVLSDETVFLDFGPYRIDLEQRLLFCGSELVPLAPKVFDTLVVLARNHGRVLSKDEMLKVVWPDTFVEEGSLARNVSTLRKVLGHNADDEAFIATIPKRGYRFVAPVTQTAKIATIHPHTVESAGAASTNRTVPHLVRTILVAALMALAGVAATYIARRTAAPGIDSVQRLELTPVRTDQFPASAVISGDGRFLAYIAAQPAPDQPGTVRVRQLATGSESEIVQPTTLIGPEGAQVPTPLWGISLTPDGSFVDFVRSSDFPAAYALWRVPSFGGAPRRLVDNVRSPVGWSPDGRQMTFVRTVPSKSDALVVAEADGSHERTLATRIRPKSFHSLASGAPIAPAWSPDGRLIALFGIDREGGTQATQVVFVDVNTGVERSVTRPLGYPRGLEWLDRDSLVLNAPAASGGPAQLWRMSYPDGRLSRLTNDLSEYGGVSLTPDRSTLVTVRFESRVGLWVGTGNWEGASEALPLEANDLVNYQLAWAGHRLLYTRAANGRLSIMSVIPGRGTPEEIIANGVSPSSTSDGRTIVFQSTDDGSGTGLWKSDADGRNRIRIATGSVQGPVITADDRFVIFRSSRGGEMLSPWIVSIDGGTPTEIIHVPAVNPVRVSPDGRRLLVLTPDPRPLHQPTPFVCDLPACSSRRPVPRYGKWTPDGQGIAYVGLPDLGNIWVQPLDGRSPRPLTRFPEIDLGIRDFAWSRDGNRLAIARHTGTSEVVIFKGLK